jgi:glycosyltransferase involved in cell wall biosynthesis
MRLLLVTKGFPPRVGGVETLCRQLAEGFARRGAEVTVLTYGGRVERDAIPTGDGAYRVIRLHSFGDAFEWSWGLVPALRRLPFDVCHVHNVHSTVVAAVWASMRRPYVVTTHYRGGGDTTAARLIHPLYRLLATQVLRGAAAVTAVSASEAALVKRDFGIDPEVIPSGVEPWGPATPAAGATTAAVGIPRAGTRVDVDLGEYALPALLDRYELVYARVNGRTGG